MPRRAYFRSKRVADCFISSGILILTLPVLLIAGALVRLTSEGPSLYRAKRVGQNGRIFAMLKFRTMTIGADLAGPAITAAGDPRITPLGKILRKTKIDELPQFWNVLIGDMSVVGPRPNDPRIVADYTAEEREVLNVPQGITDFASLWFRSQENLHEGTADVMHDYRVRVAPIKMRLGVYYAKHGSLIIDGRIFVATFLTIFFKKDPTWAFPREALTDPESLPLAA
ncbi:MAG: sugar transferase [Fimbriimonadaceae bacterium]|jgi:lipopolysaccharide/colanic/teichoic acid biosynthesis glycosyltransferase|nr:sugar transferase [Fimbriimonadaceae bacterium]